MTTTNLSTFLSTTYTGKRGFGLFNSEINNRATFACTTTKTAAVTFPAGNQSYLVRSILLTNISETGATISSEVFINSTSSAIVIANQIPINGGSTLELIKKPKIFKQSDEIRFTASANSAITAYITYQTDTSFEYFGSGATLSTASNTDIFTSSTGDSIVESIHVANITTAAAPVDVFIAQSNGTPISYIAKNFIIPVNAAIELNEQPKFLNSGEKIIAIAPFANLFTVLVSGIYK